VKSNTTVPVRSLYRSGSSRRSSERREDFGVGRRQLAQPRQLEEAGVDDLALVE
jgi:hypothetical protein